jgi:hypothetical protein
VTSKSIYQTVSTPRECGVPRKRGELIELSTVFGALPP